MSRKRRFNPDLAEKRIDTVLRMGYYVIEFSPYHCRIQDAVDFWPGNAKWRCAPGYRDDRTGNGMESLEAYMRENFPINMEG